MVRIPLLTSMTHAMVSASPHRAPPASLWRIRVRTAMAAQVSEQGRYLGGRPPYGYRLEPDPATAEIVK